MILNKLNILLCPVLFSEATPISLSGCVGASNSFGTSAYGAAVGLIVIGGAMATSALVRMTIKGVEKGIIVVFVVGACLFLAG